MPPLRSLLTFVIFGCSFLPSQGLEIEFRYNLDGEGFFDQPGSKEALEAAADFYEDLIIDELGAIDSSLFEQNGPRSWVPRYLEPDANFAQQDLPGAVDLVVPADTLIIFVGGRDLSFDARGGPGGFRLIGGDSEGFPWFNSILNRGEVGGSRLLPNSTFSEAPTDVGPWGGTLFFNSDVTWNFSLSDSSSTLGKNFLSVALHELGHVLGLGIEGPFSSWNTLVSGGQFQGPLSTSANQGVVPSVTDQGFHWADDILNSETTGVFGRLHGQAQEPVMRRLAFTAELDAFAVFTDLELAALQDIGWELNPTPRYFDVQAITANGSPTLRIPSTTGFVYSILGGDSPDQLVQIGLDLEGDGSLLSWSPPSPIPSKGFYRVRVSLLPADPPVMTVQSAPPLQVADAGKLVGPFPTVPAHACGCRF